MVRAVVLVVVLGIPLFAQRSCPATAHNPSALFTPPLPYGPAPLIETQQAHSVRRNDEEIPANMAMMTGIEIPEPGCRQIVATYKGIHTLSYMASVIR